ncbi:MAG: cyoA [Hydrocarboniphaga sp.]|uniref:ubiquinol oxidase subunit II n=1 Tax=Hydrocarboniphaga sp. TaxID=2033016 RepID=UPI00260504E4|nr:ubiquinol oxidase subunit II [Hydrocarboniphaga sp.]MDB5971713.1 cyoA [Hydrocarboniphaga sp.]
MFVRVLRKVLLLTLATLMAGCNAVVLHPFGDIAIQQRNLVVASTVLMLLVIVPVIVLTFVFAWRYRQSNTEAVYEPDWHHSTALELIIWSAPLLIVIALGALTWIGTHTLDPYRPLDRIDASRPVTADMKPLKVQVVALDWKWLFIYPDYGVATVNELAAPVDVPINFQITASTVMNSFYIPALAGQIYAMPGMETRLHAVINQAGDYEGFSANYSGAGFSGMRFRFKGMSGDDFDRWVARVKVGGSALQRDAYMQLEKPSEREPVHYFATATAGLYDKILNMCVDPSKMCMSDMMKIDAKGGLGMESVYNISRLAYDKPRRRDQAAISTPRREYVTALCASDPEVVLSSVVVPAPSEVSARFAP